MLTEATDDTAMQKIDLDIEITRLESETLEERKKRKEEKEAEDEAQHVAKAAERDCKRAEKEAEEAQRVAKAAERDRKRAEKEVEKAQRMAKASAKASELDAKWTAEVDASIKSMINGGVSFSKIAWKLGKGLSTKAIENRWYRELKESSGITKPPVQPGFPSRITWTADVDATIVRMRTDGDTFAKIASELGNGLSTNAIQNRWYRHLKDKLL